MTKPARLKAWVPMSPVAPPAPDCAGSVRQPACFEPDCSTGVASQSWAYSTCTTRILPSLPSATMARACRIIG